MKRLPSLLMCVLLMPSMALADVEPAAIRVPEPTAWTGQRLSFFVELRASGSFDGTASFSLPPLPRCIVIKTGSPVVSSKEIDGKSWFVQTHEFSLFSQQTGTVAIPPFEVRFSSRDGFTGPVSEQRATVPGASVTIRRPPDSEQIGFLVTTDQLEIRETWEPQPGPARVGDAFKRTIEQHADQMTGMALAPLPQAAPAGVRVYPADPEVSDNTERGDFVGERHDTITYVFQKAGTFTLPGITYVWWNPTREELRRQTLSAVTFDVTEPPSAAATQAPPAGRLHWLWWLSAALVLGALIVWQRKAIADAMERCRHALNAPERVTARQLLRACRRNDTGAASRAWTLWRNTQDQHLDPIPPLQAAVCDLQRHCYGPTTADAWDGRALASAYREQLDALRTRRAHGISSDLPALNPGSVESAGSY